MKPFFSIIIPYHNSAYSIGRLLGSIQGSKGAPAFEVIIVDDGSNEAYRPSLSLRGADPSLSLRAKRSNLNDSSGQAPQSQKYSVSLPRPAKGGARNDKNVCVVHLPKNMGPAVARNRGVKIARGKFVVFADSDVEFFPDTLHNLAKIYEDDPDIVAVTGVWVKEQRSNAFFPNFKALRDWSYWINERDKSGYYFLFSTRIASIKKSVFQRLGGFDEKYPAPLVEDIELTYRIARRYAIIFAPNVRVRHEFESFWPVAKKYFLRAYYWTKLYQRRKKFDPVATTLQEALTTVSGVAVVGVVFLGFLGYLGHLSYLGYLEKLWLFVIFLHLFLIRKFLAFMAREKGIVFAVKGFFMGLILYCFIFAGALAGRLK